MDLRKSYQQCKKKAAQKGQLFLKKEIFYSNVEVPGTPSII